VQINKLIRRTSKAKWRWSEADDGGQRAGLWAEKIVIATGSSWNTDGTNCVSHSRYRRRCAKARRSVTPEQVFEGKKPIGKRVTVLNYDTYFMATSLAERLAMAGHEVRSCRAFIWRRIPHFTLEYSNIMRRNHELKFKDTSNTTARSSSRRMQIISKWGDGYKANYRGKGVSPRTENTSQEWIEFDSLVLVTGRHSDDKLYRELKTRKSEWAKNDVKAVYIIGDAEAPRLMADATSRPSACAGDRGSRCAIPAAVQA